MQKILFTFIIVLLILAGSCFNQLLAKDGDIIYVVSHDKEKVITDPSKGYNNYPQFAQFPANDVEYRKVMLYITYACPDSLHCGEWDYIDNVYLRQVDSLTNDTLDIELARIISPYGWWFDSTWSFKWHVDITDFGFLLHDSVEIVFRHTGYEKTDDRGWLITLDFELTEGTPAMRPFGFEPLWNGSFPYGDTSKPMDSSLHPITFAHDRAEIARVRIHQTGHGMDDFENCAEFCKKYRDLYFDSEIIDRREIWRKCGKNALYPQAGTWIFDRANWCPGEVVYPDVYDLDITPDSTHTVDINMQDYINPNKPSANYAINSYLFYYEEPWAENDVSIEEIIIPSSSDVNSRINPACGNPKIKIKNNGSSDLSYCEIWYGIKDAEQTSYLWEGTLTPQETELINLPSYNPAIKSGVNEFSVLLVNPNKTEDEYPHDNTAISKVVTPPTINNQFILEVHTNKEPSHNSYYLTNSIGDIVGGRLSENLLPERTYRDTFDLDPGCYQLLVSDTAGDGLKFWFNTDGGYGYVRLLDMQEKLIKSFNSDFGSEINYSFIAEEIVSTQKMTDSLPIIEVFPTRTDGKFNIYPFFNELSDMTIEIASDSTQEIIFQQNYTKIKDKIIPIDISSQPDGRYSIKITADDRTINKRVRVKN